MRFSLLTLAAGAMLAASAAAQVSSPPPICFAFNDNVAPTASLPLVTGGEILVEFTAPMGVAIERIDVLIGFVLSGTMTVDVYQANGPVLGAQIGSGGVSGYLVGWVPLTLSALVPLVDGAEYALRFTVSGGTVLINGDATQTAPLSYLLNCGPNPPALFPPCASYPPVGVFAPRLRFRSVACGLSPLATATLVGTGCGLSPAPTLTNGAPPLLGATFPITVTSSSGGGFAQLYWAFGPATSGLSSGIGSCFVYVDPVSAGTLAAMGLNPIAIVAMVGSQATAAIVIPNDPTIAGAVVTMQAAVVGSMGFPTPFGFVQFTNALELTVGY